MKSKTNFAKRAFSVLIAVLMLATMLPTAVVADDTAPVTDKVIEGIEWSKGFVSAAGSLTTGNNYSRSSVITIEKAGSTVYFIDSSDYASSGALIFSLWDNVDGTWTFNSETIYKGDNKAIYRDIDSGRLYCYTTSKDNESIRISYKSGQTDSNTPTFVTVHVRESSAVEDLLYNASFVPVTNFAEIGAGVAENISTDTTFALTENGGVSVVRDNTVSGNDWIQNFDWKFNEAQNWTGMTGILVKVDYSRGANTDGTTGGHGLNIGIHTATGSEAVSNDPLLGGYAWAAHKNAWFTMVPSYKYLTQLVVNPVAANRYDGYVFIPASAFGTVEGLNSVTALSFQNGATTSGATYIEKVWLVKAADTTVSISMDGYQDTTAQGGDTYDVRFLAKINSLSVKSYGFTVKATYNDGSDKTVTKTYTDLTTVYTGVIADGEQQNTANGEYFAPMTIKGIPAGLSVTFTVTPHIVYADGTVVTTLPATYTVNATA